MNIKAKTEYMREILLALSLISLCSFSDQEQSTLPSIELKKLNGASFNSTEIFNDGKPVVILVWEISCKPCLQEFDNISKHYRQWQQETGVKIVAISIDDNRNYNKVGQMVRSKGWPYEFYQDKNQDIKRAMGIQVCPYSLILDRERKVVWRKAGYAPGDEAILYDIVHKLSKGEKISNE